MDSDEDGSGAEKKVKVDPMPEHKVRFTDMPDDLVEKAIRSKWKNHSSFWLTSIPLHSITQRNIKLQVRQRGGDRNPQGTERTWLCTQRRVCGMARDCRQELCFCRHLLDV